MNLPRDYTKEKKLLVIGKKENLWERKTEVKALTSGISNSRPKGCMP